MKQIDKDELQSIASAVSCLFKAIPQEMEYGKRYTWQCGCGGTVSGIRTNYNGHLYAECDKCKLAVRQ